MKRNQKNEILLKYKMIISTRAIRGVLYLESLKNKIKLVKELFVYEMEQGEETFIPKELS